MEVLCGFFPCVVASVDKEALGTWGAWREVEREDVSAGCVTDIDNPRGCSWRVMPVQNHPWVGVCTTRRAFGGSGEELGPRAVGESRKD